jgi:hypothetical protein
MIVAAERFEIERSLPHGHVVAVLGTLRRIGLDPRVRPGGLLPRRPERLATLVLALIVARVVEPAAKLATARQLSEATASHSLGAVLRLGEVDEDELYRALDLLGAAQPAIERALARRHLKDGTLVLYDVTSSYLEGRCCELGRRGHSPAMAVPTGRRSSLGCCAPPTAVRWRRRCSRATPPICRRSPRRSTSSSHSSGWCWSATAA